MIPLFIFLTCLISIHVCGDTDIQGNFFGKGVCSVHRTDTKQVLVFQRHLYPEMSYSLCWNFPPWCKEPTGRELIDFITVPENIKHEILILKCCPNYTPSEDKLSCLPVCSSHCLPNKCISPNNCSKCEAEYFGPLCTPGHPTDVPPTSKPKPGPCSCPNENFVCTSDLRCICAEGFDGFSCQHIIPPPAHHVNPHGCSYYEIQVGALVGALIGSAVLIAILMKKRVGFRNTFEPLNDRDASSI